MIDWRGSYMCRICELRLHEDGHLAHLALITDKRDQVEEMSKDLLTVIRILNKLDYPVLYKRLIDININIDRCL